MKLLILKLRERLKRIILAIDNLLIQSLFQGTTFLNSSKLSKIQNDLTPPQTHSPTLTIVCVAYKAHQETLTFVHSILNQKHQNFKLIVIHDGFDKKTEELLEPIAKENPDTFELVFTNKRYNDYGHSLREIGIKRASTKYILITNHDNYYNPHFTQYMLSQEVVKTDPDLIICNMTHGHIGAGITNNPKCDNFKTLPIRDFIDIGCFIAKTKNAKAVGFRDKSFAGDATYFEDLLSLKNKPSIIKLETTLLVHN